MTILIARAIVNALFVIARRRDFASALTGIPLLFGGAAIDLAGVSRFATATADKSAGQEIALIVLVLAVAFAAGGAVLARTSREETS